MEEFKDHCQGLIVQCDEIAEDMRHLPTDYKLAERYTDIDQEIYDMLEWYEQVRRERKHMDGKMSRLKYKLKSLNNDVQNLKLLEFSHDQHGGSYSRLPQIRRP
jgi:chromosome segregation ATPase